MWLSRDKFHNYAVFPLVFLFFSLMALTLFGYLPLSKIVVTLILLPMVVIAFYNGYSMVTNPTFLEDDNLNGLATKILGVVMLVIVLGFLFLIYGMFFLGITIVRG